MKDKFNLFYFGKQFWQENKKQVFVNTCSLRHIKWIIWHHKIALFKCHSLVTISSLRRWDSHGTAFFLLAKTVIHAHSGQSRNEWAGKQQNQIGNPWIFPRAADLTQFWGEVNLREKPSNKSCRFFSSWSQSGDCSSRFDKMDWFYRLPEVLFPVACSFPWPWSDGARVIVNLHVLLSAHG